MAIPFLVLKDKIVDQIRKILPMDTKEINDRSYVRFTFVYKGADFTVSLKEVQTTFGFPQTSKDVFEVVVSAYIESTRLYGNKFGVNGEGNWNHQALVKSLKDLRKSLDLRQNSKKRRDTKKEKFATQVQRILNTKIKESGSSRVTAKIKGVQISVRPTAKNKIEEIVLTSNQGISFEQFKSLVRILK